MNNKKTAKEKPVLQAFFLMANMIISIFAFSFLIAAVSVISTPVAAAATSTECCEKVKDKDLFCQNTLSTSCDTKFAHAPTSCDSTSFCRLGCCYDGKEGTCAESTPRKVCDLRGGTWDLSASCNIAQCQKGCCVLGDQASLTTLVRCKKLASFYGLETDYRSAIVSEQACVDIAQAEDKGACVITAGGVETTCKLTTRVECKSMTHNETAFNKGFLCSAEKLGTPCTRQASTGCIEGKDEVYWFDSCGNTENIYDANKDRSWNNGKILDKEKSCDPIQDNAKDANCGNCDYYMGSMCGKARTGVEPRPAEGDYICRDLNCYNTYNGKDYKHGESWCVFDGAVGLGRDAPGSRHWRHLCVMGEEKVEPCDDYRQGICVQDSVDIEGQGKYTEAMCRANGWKMCFDYNSKSNAEKQCNDNNDCMWMQAWKLKLCVPNFPPGFNIKAGGDLAGGATTFCSMGSSSCSVAYQKTLTKGWQCVGNCECKEQAWVNTMDKLCTSMGDCGGKANIAGAYTKDGYEISGTENVPDKNVSNKDDGFGGFGGLLMSGGIAIGAIWIFNNMKLITTSQATALKAAEVIGGKTARMTSLKGAEAGYSPGKGLTLNQWLSINAKQGTGFANIAVNVAGAYMVSMLVNGLFGLKGEAANMVTMAGVTTSLATSVYGNMMASKVAAGTAQPFLGLGGGAWFAPLIWAAVVMLVVALIMKMMKIGATRTEKVTFTCLPWQPPVGGADCQKCNKEPIGGEMKPCTKYRCDSLGQGCSLLNEGTGKETCTWINKDDSTAPVIKPLKSVLTKDHSYKEIKPCPPGPGCFKIEKEGSKDGCIKSFTPLQFGIEANEPAQCKLDTNHTGKFDDMQFYFGDNLYLYNHTMMMSLPSPASINALSNETTSPTLKNDGKYTMYIRCRDGNGNWNLGEMAMQFCVDPGPDTTPPMIMRTSIENGAPISYNAKNVPLDVYLNEPSACKWSRTDQDYNNMNNTFICASSVEQIEGDMTYKCSTILSSVNDKVTNTFYFRCKDQPWLAGVNESDRNINKESYVFKLEGTIPLNITKVEPNGTVKGGAEPISVKLTAETANGYSSGDAKCSFATNGYDGAMVEFFDTGSYKHEQTLDLYAGDYTFYVMCRDDAGNTDQNMTKFKVELDKTPPIAVRAYQDGGMLKIVTDEDSECKYGIKDCNFDFLSATDMPFENSTEHTAEWRTDITYYIKCKDQYGNMPVPSACSIQVDAYDIQTNSE
ncbi:MAG: hypothetical protein V1660_03875 [archaeon]